MVKDFSFTFSFNLKLIVNKLVSNVRKCVINHQNVLLINLIINFKVLKMLKTTFVARASDGLILCETYNYKADIQLDRLKMKAKELLEKGKF